MQIKDERLSFKSKGILAYLLSKPDNWKVVVKDLINNSNNGKSSVYSGLRELKKYGYYKKCAIKNKLGRISHWESIIFECPDDNYIEQIESNNKINPYTENHQMDKNSLNITSYPFTDFLYVENEDIENQYLENLQRNNNYINNTNQSVR